MWNRNPAGIKRIAETQASKHVSSELLDSSFQTEEKRMPVGWNPKRLTPSLVHTKPVVKRPLYKKDGKLQTFYSEGELFGPGGAVVRVLLWRRYLKEIRRNVIFVRLFFRGFLHGRNFVIACC